MFSLHNLVGTPQRRSNAISNNTHPDRNSYEFTPIGNRPRGNRTAANQKHSNDANKRYVSDKVTNYAVADTSFDDTSDNFNNTTVTGIADAPKIAKSARSAPSSRGPLSFNNNFGPTNPQIVDNGIHSIKEQQNGMKRLQTENYNLKIEVATLTQFLKQTPEEQRELASQNIDLKQKLLEGMRHAKELEATIREYEFQANKENVPESDQFRMEDNIKHQYREIISEKDQQISTYQHQIETLKQAQLSSDRSSNIPQDLLDKLGHLQKDNQSLRRRLDEYNESSKKELNDLQIRLDHAKSDNQLLQSQISSRNETSGNSESTELRQSKQKISELELSASQLKNELEEERSSHQENLKSFRALLNEKSSALSIAESDVKTWREKYQNISARTHSIESDALLKAREELANLEQQKQNEIAKLKREMSRVQHQLEEKSQQESELRDMLKTMATNASNSNGIAADVERYRSQIDILRSKEESLISENNRLRDEMAELQDQAYQVNVDASKVHSIQKENDELIDKLNYYEKEYALAQEGLENAENHMENMSRNKVRMETKIVDLEKENDELISKLREHSKRPNSAANFENTEYDKRRDEREKQELIGQIDDLTFQMRRLQKQLDFEKNNKDIQNPNLSYLETEYQKVSKEKNQLRLAKDEYEIQTQELKSKCNKLQTTIDDKESLIETLEGRVRDLNKQLRLSSLDETTEKHDISKLKNSYEIKVREIEAEFERLENDYREQVSYYKNKANELMDQRLEDAYSKRNQVMDTAGSPLTALLEHQLEHTKELNNELSRKLSESMSKEGKSASLISSMTSDMNDCLKRNETLQRDKARLEGLVSELETDINTLRSENNRLESKSKDLAAELNTSFKHCTRMAKKLNDLNFDQKASVAQEDDIFRARRNNAYLREQIDQLNQRLYSTKISASSNTSTKVSDELKLMNHQLQYYKIVLHDINLKSNDLKLMNDFIIKAIKNSNTSIKNDLVRLAHCGIYPDYTSIDLQRLRNGGRISFKVLAQFVLAMVKMRRRSEKAELRKRKLSELKNEIARNRITLLAN